MHIVSKFQFLIHIFTVEKLKNKIPKKKKKTQKLIIFVFEQLVTEN